MNNLPFSTARSARIASHGTKDNPLGKRKRLARRRERRAIKVQDDLGNHEWRPRRGLTDGDIC